MSSKTAKLLQWLAFLFVAVLFMTFLWRMTATPRPILNIIPISQLAADVQESKVERINVDGDGRTLNIIYTDDTAARSRINGTSSVEEVLSTYGVSPDIYAQTGLEVIYGRPSNFGRLLNPIITLFSVALIMGFIYYMYRQNQGRNNQATTFGKSRARLFTSDHPSVTFDDVAGADEAKEELREIVEFLREPDKFMRFGARIPKGVLLVGPPGTGKTLLAKAVSGEAGVPFFSIAGSEFVEMFVGVGASRVRDLFEQAKRHSPCLIFIDEIDAVGRQRGAGLGGGHDEREQTLNQILVEMDGFGTDQHIIMLAATNRPDILDPALLRPGRFDRRVVIDRPDMKGREAIFNVHMKGKPLGNIVDATILAKATPGFSGADIENTVNEAALLAARRDRTGISMVEFQEAIERVQLGPERRSLVISKEERELVAWHEAGHAVMAWFLPDALPVRKVTIIPRGQAGGVTWFLEDDKRFLTSKRCKAIIRTALGGRIAEEIAFDDVTTGAQNDLQRITEIARAMVTQYGMSESLGLRVYGKRQDMVFLGKQISEQRDYSDALAEQIDQEVRQIIDAAYTETHQLLEQHRDKLDLIADMLLTHETLDMEQFASLMKTGKLPPPTPSPTLHNHDADKVWSRPPNLDLPPSPSPI